MNEYKVYGKLEGGRTYSYNVSCESESLARAVIFNNFAKINATKSAELNLMVQSMYVTELQKVGA